MKAPRVRGRGPMLTAPAEAGGGYAAPRRGVVWPRRESVGSKTRHFLRAASDAEMISLQSGAPPQVLFMVAVPSVLERSFGFCFCRADAAVTAERLWDNGTRRAPQHTASSRCSSHWGICG